ncbi:hypothetical protein HY029_00185 [Candidatus Gottesmanbacteria bacterium]|nr:hypothetical protein [Candidatus Gottesmanbacteria bacterium]
MKKWFLVTIPIAVIAFVVTPNVWHSPMGLPEPTPSQLPFFIILTIFESVSLGLGVSFLLFGYSIVKNVSKNSKFVVWSLYLSTSWFLLNWWVHDGLHKVNGMNLQGLLYIEYGFHVTMITMAALAAYSFLKVFSKK